MREKGSGPSRETPPSLAGKPGNAFREKRKDVMTMHTDTAIVFDVDGTLWDTTGIVAESWTKVLDRLSIRVEGGLTVRRLKQEFGKTPEVIAADLLPGLSAAEQKTVIDACFRQEEIDLERNTQSLLYEGVEDTLAELARGRGLYIVSNCQSGYIELFLKKNRLERHILDFECAGNTGRPKGDNIRLLMDRNRITRAVYVGDTQGDYEASRQAGIPFIFAAYGYGAPEGYAHRISRFPELLDLPL